ncbi:thioredoxin [Carnobacterium sp. AT7]|uniref:thioredoxin family protein n=1 Tax=Carnobacterium TaxID=2747 RepID=UPI00015F21F6|nr:MULTISPECIES: thioredoxin family protein [Carnobacterium]EDP68330.1 thioredoxin [Carnobacterium sp. AT7]
MNTFPQATSIDQVLRYIKENKLTFVYISKENCGICHVIQPQVQEMLTEFPAIKPIQVSADDIPEVASQFTVFTVPALLLFVEGKEVIREARFVVMEELHRKFQRVVENS